MSDDEVMPSFAEVAAEDPSVSVENEHEAVERLEDEAERTEEHDDRELMPDEEVDQGVDFRDATSPAPTIGDTTPPL